MQEESSACACSADIAESPIHSSLRFSISIGSWQKAQKAFHLDFGHDHETMQRSQFQRMFIIFVISTFQRIYQVLRILLSCPHSFNENLFSLGHFDDRLLSILQGYEKQ